MWKKHTAEMAAASSFRAACLESLKECLELASTQPKKFEMRPVWGAKLNRRIAVGFRLRREVPLVKLPCKGDYGFSCLGSQCNQSIIDVWIGCERCHSEMLTLADVPEQLWVY